MASTRTPDDDRPPRQEREGAARTWLGGTADGSERLARIFQVGPAVRASELEGEIAELRARLDVLEEELWALRRHPDAVDARPEADDLPFVDLPRALLPREPDYRLARCEGFAVRAGSRLLGVVEGVRYHSRTDRPDVLEVRGGRFGQRLLLVPVSDIESIEPGDEAVIVGEGWSLPEPRERVRAHLGRLIRRRRPAS